MYQYSAHRLKIASEFGALNSINRDSSLVNMSNDTFNWMSGQRIFTGYYFVLNYSLLYKLYK